MKTYHLSFSIKEINKLIVERESNHIVNQDWFAENIIGIDRLQQFKESYFNFCGLIGLKPSEIGFDNQFWTNILNVYYYPDTFSMLYGCIGTFRYRNNSIPDLVVIGLCVPQYSTLTIE